MHNVEPKHNDVIITRDEFGDPVLKRLKIKDGTNYLVNDTPYPLLKTLAPNGDFYVVGVVGKGWRDIKY